MKLIFVGDPMCSWCYGFGKELTEASQAFPDVPLQIVVGGIGAGATETMTHAMKDFRLNHWSRVEAVSGLPFNRESFKNLKNFVYDTEPACRAVVAARMMEPSIDQLSVFRAIQHGFYADGLDITDGAVLADIVAKAIVHQGFPVEAEAVLKVWRAREVIDATRGDFQTARQWGISSFPTLLLQDGNNLYNLNSGYASAAELRSRIEAGLTKLAA